MAMRVLSRKNPVGRLNKRVQVFEQQPTGDDKFIIQLAAEIVFLQGRDVFEAEQQMADTTHIIRVRYNKVVSRRHYIMYGERRFEIRFINNVDEANRFLDIYCKEKVV
jgi:SPP1 family predicted phage head-tail adaptor